MRAALKDLISKTVIFQYKLPELAKAIDKGVYSTEDDHCYSIGDNNALSEIIYNSIIDYAFNEYDLEDADLQSLHAEALETRIHFDGSKDIDDQLKYGFFGEVLLYCFLCSMFGATPLISRGYFYSSTENEETKGYDSYHLIEQNGEIQLWFGEVKFHAQSTSAINGALGNLDKVLSDEYLKKNIHVLPKFIPLFNYKGSQMEGILRSWRKNPSISILEEMKKHKIKLVYPVLLLFNGKKDFDETIKAAIKYVNDNYQAKTFPLSVELSLFFVLSPVVDTKVIKTQVLEWIKAKKSLI